MKTLNLKLRNRLSYFLLPVMLIFAFPNINAVTRGPWSVASNYQYPAPSTQDQQPLTINTNPFKYSGYYFDSKSGLYYLHARYYSPELMRFINRDTYDLSNRYNYCDDEPVSQTDPTGHMPKWLDYMFGKHLTNTLLGMATLGIGIGIAIVSGGTLLPAMWLGVGSAVVGGGGEIAEEGLTAGGVIKKGGSCDEAITWGLFGVSIALAGTGGLFVLGDRTAASIASHVLEPEGSSALWPKPALAEGVVDNYRPMSEAELAEREANDALKARILDATSRREKRFRELYAEIEQRAHIDAFLDGKENNCAVMNAYKEKYIAAMKGDFDDINADYRAALGEDVDDVGSPSLDE